MNAKDYIKRYLSSINKGNNVKINYRENSITLSKEMERLRLENSRLLVEDERYWRAALNYLKKEKLPEITPEEFMELPKYFDYRGIQTTLLFSNLEESIASEIYRHAVNGNPKISRYIDRIYELRNSLADSCVPLVMSRIGRSAINADNQGKGSSDDLFQDIFIGLLKAAHRYDYKQGAAFSTYAVSYLRWDLISHLKDNTLIGIPDNLVWKLKSELKKLDPKDERRSRYQELLEHIYNMKHLLSLESKVAGYDDLTLGGYYL